MALLRRAVVFCALLLAARLAAGEAVDADAPVAVVGDTAITLRDLEDALLKREGNELVEELVHQRLEGTDWSKLKDDDVVVEIAGVRMRRGLVAAQLLRQKAAGVREELINIAVARQALAKEGVDVGEPEIQAEIARMQRKLDRTLEDKGGAKLSLDDYIRQTQKMSLADFSKQEGFRMGAGLHVLAERRLRAEIDDHEAEAWYAAHKARYDVTEGVDLSLIAIPYQQSPGPDGKPTVTDEEKARLLNVMQMIRQQIVGGVAFAQMWQRFGSSWDPQADQGRAGWVGHDGARAQKGAKPVPQAVVDAAFAATGTYPILLEPIAHDAGVALALVHGRRAAQASTFESAKPKVIQDLVDDALEERVQRLVGELRNELPPVDYRSLPALVEARAAQAGLPGDAPPAKQDAKAEGATKAVKADDAKADAKADDAKKAAQ